MQPHLQMHRCSRHAFFLKLLANELGPLLLTASSSSKLSWTPTTLLQSRLNLWSEVITHVYYVLLLLSTFPPSLIDNKLTNTESPFEN